MVFNIYDGTLTRIGEINTFLSSTWEEAYCDRGLCQIVVTNSAAASRMLVPGNFVGRVGRKTVWQIKTKEKRSGQLWISGFTVNYTLLEDRILEGTHTSSVIETDLRTAVMAARPAPIVGLSTLRGLTGSVESEHTYTDLFSLSKDLCGAVDYGFRFVHDRQLKKLLFDVWQGEEKPNAKFAEAFGNLANLVLQQSDVNFKNVAYVGGSGEGAARVFVTCGDTTKTGLARHEMFVDARDLQQEDKTLAAYKAILQQRGLEKLNEANQKLAVTYDVDPDRFGKDYDLGDVIYSILPEDGLKLFVRIIAFKEVVEKNRVSVAITVGSPIIQTIGGKRQ